MRKIDSFIKKYGAAYGTALYKWLQHKSGRACHGLPPLYERPLPSSKP